MTNHKIAVTDTLRLSFTHLFGHRSTFEGHVHITPRLIFNRLRYKHLLMLVTLGDTGNVHRTAETLHLSQPGVTRMLHEIENMFECELFERLSRGMRPTELGVESLRFARNALSRLERFTENLESLRDGGFGNLSIGAIMGAAPDLVMQAVADIKTLHPRLRIRVMGDTTDQLVDLLERGQIDLAIAREVPFEKRDLFSFEPIGNEHLCVAVKTGHPLCAVPANALTLEMLANAGPWLLQPATSPARLAIEQAFHRAKLSFPMDIIECGSVFAMLQLVQITEGILVLSEAVVSDHIRSGLITLLPIETGAALPPFGMLLRRHEALSPQLETFLDMVRQRAKVVPAAPSALATGRHSRLSVNSAAA